MADGPQHSDQTMDTATSFDLNHAIDRWRQSLNASPSLRGETLDELESHLRDSVDGLQSARLSDEEAFLIASKRIGRGPTLAAEFSKVNPNALWLDRLLWMLIGVQGFSVINGLIAAVTQGAAVLVGWPVGNVRDASLYSGMSTVLLAGLQLLLTVIVFMQCWRLLTRQSHPWAARIGPMLRSPTSLAVLGVVLCTMTFALTFFPVLLTSRLYSGPGISIAQATAYSGAFVRIILMASLVFSTLYVARRRLGLTSS
jgi:hypothetical protein